MFGKYVAYVGSYTKSKAKGITILDVNMETGEMKRRKEVEVSNPSYIKVDENRNILYSIDDAGLKAFSILVDGDLEFLSEIGINGMRGCYIDIDTTGQFIYVAGYHDGKVTMISLNDDGSFNKITDEKYFKGMGKPYEDSYRPHVSCCKLTPFERFLCVADLSQNNYKVYEIDRQYGTLNQTSLIPCELGSRPREIVFSQTGRFAYTVGVINKQIEAFKYSSDEHKPEFTSIQKLKLLGKGMSEASAPYAITRNPNGTYLLVSIVEDNSVTFVKRDKETGLMEIEFNLPISGEFPKDIQVFPNDKFLVSCNHESNQVTVFEIDYEKKLIYMLQRPIDIYHPNCIRFVRLKDNV